MVEQESQNKFNPREWVPAVMALGTWLFAMHEAYHGRHYVPDEWMVGIILSPYGGKIYSIARKRVGETLKRLPKKE